MGLQSMLARLSEKEACEPPPDHNLVSRNNVCAYVCRNQQPWNTTQTRLPPLLLACF